MIESPCLSICVMEEDAEYCRGCFRTLDEISEWSWYSDAERKRIMAELPARKQTYQRTKKSIERADDGV